MGRKVHPIGFRLKVTKTWDARWFAEGEQYVDHLQEDLAIRKLIKDEAENAGVSRIEIERFPGKVKIIIHTSKPGVLIGRKGANVKILRKSLEELVGKTIDVDIKEIETFIDQDLLSYDVLWAEAGTPHAVFALTPDDLIKITPGEIIDIK